MILEVGAKKNLYLADAFGSSSFFRASLGVELEPLFCLWVTCQRKSHTAVWELKSPWHIWAPPGCCPPCKCCPASPCSSPASPPPPPSLLRPLLHQSQVFPPASGWEGRRETEQHCNKHFIWFHFAFFNCRSTFWRTIVSNIRLRLSIIKEKLVETLIPFVKVCVYMCACVRQNFLQKHLTLYEQMVEGLQKQ